MADIRVEEKAMTNVTLTALITAGLEINPCIHFIMISYLYLRSV